MGNSGSPDDCQTSEEAKAVGDRFMAMGNARFDDADGEFGVGSAASAAQAFNQATKYYERAEELKRQGK